MTNITAGSNTLGGVELFVGNTTGNGGISSATLLGITSNNNLRDGIRLQGNNSGPLTASLTNSNFTGNAQYGVYVDDDTSGTWVLDLGGGTLGGTGGNRIFGNTLEDIFVDMDGGQLKAQSNWWGQSGGPLGADVVLNSGTLDSTNPLATDPRP
jgi:hypothetical protein